MSCSSLINEIQRSAHFYQGSLLLPKMIQISCQYIKLHSCSFCCVFLLKYHCCRTSMFNQCFCFALTPFQSVEVAADCFTCGKCDFKLSRERQKVETLTDELEKLQLYITDFPRLRKGNRA